LESHFPNIINHCKEVGYDVFTQCIPVVPAQHYFMGGVKVNHESKTTMDYLYAVGETACNGVHGRNRLASNSLLESLVFAARAAADITQPDGSCRKVSLEDGEKVAAAVDLEAYQDSKKLAETYHKMVWDEIVRRTEEDKQNV
jgi:L-aspartate oxidase